MARFLVEAQRLPSEVQASLAALINKDHRLSLIGLVDEAYPPGSERRWRLGRALVRRCGGDPSGVPTRVLETTVAHTLRGLDVPPELGGQSEGPVAGRPNAQPLARGQASNWSDQAASILAPRLRTASDALLRLEGRVELSRTLLSTVGLRSPLTRFGVEQASARLERAHITAGLARILLRPDAAWAGLAPRAAMARREVADLRPVLYQVHEVLARLARRSTAIRPTPGEIGDIDRAAQTAIEALNVLQAVAEVLLDLAGRTDVALGSGDLRALGLAYPGGTVAPQTRWNEESVDELARRREKGRRPRGGEARATSRARVGASDVLVALKASGLELAQVDPGQLREAARFVSAAPPRARPERLAKVVDAFHVLASAPRAVWSRSMMASHLAGMARLPTRALLSLSDNEVHERFQEVVRAVNMGPGPTYTRIGPYHLTFETDESGHVVRASRLKNGVLVRAAGALGRSGPLALSTLRHYRATEPLGRLLAGSLDTGETLGRSAFVRLANAGVALLRRSTPLRDGAERPPLPARLDRASRELEDAALMGSAVASYRSAERATSEARRALASALSSSDPSAVARAKRRLEAAEEAKRTALQECATGLLHDGPRETAVAARRGFEDPRQGGLARTEQPASTERPATTGASLRGLALQLRQTRSLVERVSHIASDLQELSARPGTPEGLRAEAHATSAAVDQAIQAFRRGVGTADDEGAIQAARFAFEQRVRSLVADHLAIHRALAQSGKGVAPGDEKIAAPTAPKRRS